MIATTVISALPAMEFAGTIGPGPANLRRRLRPGSSLSPGVLIGVSVMDLETSVFERHRPRRMPLHQIGIMRCDHHRGAESVELDEETQDAPRHGRVDIAGRLVCQENLRDDR